MWNFRKLILLIAGICIFKPVVADISENQLEQLSGWTIVGSKQISGYVKDDGSEESSFEGCEHGRVLLFSDGSGVRCQSYGYQYAYMPTAIILAKSITYEGKTLTMVKIIVKSQIYDAVPL